MCTHEQLTCDTHVIAMARLATGESMATSSSSTDTIVCSPSVSGVDSDTSSTSCSCTSVPSLFDRLKAPQRSQLARKRAIKTNCGKLYKRHTILSAKNDPKSVSPAERVLQYKDEPLTVSAGKLFCFACREEVGLKRV